MSKELQVDDTVELQYADDEDAWICPVCGHPNYTTYFHSDYDHCPNCRSDFEVFTAQRLTHKGDLPERGRHDRVDIREWDDPVPVSSDLVVTCPECGSEDVTSGDIIFQAVCEDCGYEDSFGAFEHERQDTDGKDSE